MPTKKKKSSKKKTAKVHKLAKRNDLAALMQKLEQGAYVDEVDEYQMTGLMWASARGHASVVSELLQYSAFVNHTNKDGWTSLMCSALGAHEECMGLLLEAGADRNIHDTDGKTALMCSAVVNYKDFEPDQREGKRQANGRCILKLLASPDIDIDAKDHFNRTALMWSCMLENVVAVQTLLSADPAPDVGIRNNDHCTCLMWACQKGNVELTRLLLAANASPLEHDTDGWTALLWAAKKDELLAPPEPPEDASAEEIKEYNDERLLRTNTEARQVKGSMEILPLLIDAKADIDQPDRTGQTALIWAAKDGDMEMIQKLSDLGANMTLRDNSLKSAEDYLGNPEHGLQSLMLEHQSSKSEACNACQEDDCVVM